MLFLQHTICLYNLQVEETMAWRHWEQSLVLVIPCVWAMGCHAFVMSSVVDRSPSVVHLPVERAFMLVHYIVAIFVILFLQNPFTFACSLIQNKITFIPCSLSWVGLLDWSHRPTRLLFWIGLTSISKYKNDLLLNESNISLCTSPGFSTAFINRNRWDVPW